VFLHPSHELSVMMWWSCPKEVNGGGEDRGGASSRSWRRGCYCLAGQQINGGGGSEAP
jgi:hypothetical protein